MPKSALRWLMIAAMITGFNASGWAQDSDPGKNGVSVQLRAMPRRGWQIISTVLKTPPADLTVLAKRNDGVFPIAAVNEIIDGRMLIAAHRNREMPIWGFDVMGRSRISVIVDYLNRIQEK